MSNYFPKRPLCAPLHTLSKLYDFPVGFVNPPPTLRLSIALFAVAEVWLLLDIGWFVLFHVFSSRYASVTIPKPTSGDRRWAKIGKIGRRRHRFWRIFWSDDAFFVEAPKLKVSLTDRPIFKSFEIGEASGDGHPMISRQSADGLRKFPFWYWWMVARSLGVNRPTITRQSVDDILSKNCLQTDAVYWPLSFG